ncbi:MAG: amidohydrolase family protein [Bacteroidales bacterium]|nr:amidohydrolase family protein [Bacteroidales bacterium]MDP3003679.1 amidohydrolase family protein [Bacteroidales bacterium]
MKRFSAQYIITNSGPPLKRAMITTEDDGTILSIEDTGGDLEEKHSVEFYNGIIIPGFVNCHCHLELSHMKGSIAQGSCLGGFVKQVRNTRDNNSESIIASACSADNEMYSEGIVLCADICNTSLSFNIKKESRICYINLLEVFGIDAEKASRRMDEIIKVAETAEDMNLPFSIVPHSVYSMSLSLLRLLREKSDNNKVTSIHFMETYGEKAFLENHSGPFMTSYKLSGLITSGLETVKSHVDAVLNEITLSGNLILVHNTFADRETIKKIKERKNLFWCLCPNSNIYIENEMPPLDLLIEEDCEIVIGTDSLASNNKLSILEELKTLQLNFPAESIEELVRWATINGAKALGEEGRFGKIESGKKPGLLLLQNVDLNNMKLLPGSFVTRLI